MSALNDSQRRTAYNVLWFIAFLLGFALFITYVFLLAEGFSLPTLLLAAHAFQQRNVTSIPATTTMILACTTSTKSTTD